MLTNAFYGAVGKSNFGGYNYRAWTLTINHLAILQTYNLYRQFQADNVLAIRSDCVFVKEQLPLNLLKENHQYHIKKINKMGFRDKSNIFDYDQMELKSFAGGEEREELIKKFKDMKRSLVNKKKLTINKQ